MAVIVIAASHAKPPAPVSFAPPDKLEMAASRDWVRQIAETTNNALYGNINAVTDVTLLHGSATTTVSWARISPYSGLFFCPLTANAAAEIGAGTLYVSFLTNGSATLTHANNAQTDRNYRVLIAG